MYAVGKQRPSPVPRGRPPVPKKLVCRGCNFTLKFKSACDTEVFLENTEWSVVKRGNRGSTWYSCCPRCRESMAAERRRDGYRVGRLVCAVTLDQIPRRREVGFREVYRRVCDDYGPIRERSVYAALSHLHCEGKVTRVGYQGRYRYRRVA